MDLSRACACLDKLVKSNETAKPAWRLPLQATTTPLKFTFLESAGGNMETVISVQTGMAFSERNSIPFLRMRTALTVKSSRVVWACTVTGRNSSGDAILRALIMTSTEYHTKVERQRAVTKKFLAITAARKCRAAVRTLPFRQAFPAQHSSGKAQKMDGFPLK